MIKTVLVTGDKGYIGSVLVPLLLRRNIRVTGLDTDYYRDCFVSGYDIAPEYSSIQKDIRHLEKRDLEGIEGIIHLAALSNDPMGDIDESLTEDINYKSTIRLAELARESGVRSFLYSSSCSIYGKGSGDVVDEANPTNPLTAYARSKIRSEEDLARMSGRSFYVGLMRNSTVYGFSPKFRDDLVVNNLVVSALLNGELRVMSDGTPWRPLIDVRDISAFFVRILLGPDEILNGKVINIGFSENNFQVKDVVQIIKDVMPDVSVRFTGEHGADTRSYRVSFDLLKKTYGDVPLEWPLEKSVRDLVERLRDIDRISLEDKRFTRLAVLKKLMAGKRLDPSLFWSPAL